MKKIEKKNILISVPVPLLKKLDSAAKAMRRSRTAEVCVLLEQSLKAGKAVKQEMDVAAA